MAGKAETFEMVKEGEHTVRVDKPNGPHHHFVRQKRIFVGAETSTKLTLRLKNKPTEAYEQYKRNRWQRNGSVVTDPELGLVWQDNRAAKKIKKTGMVPNATAVTSLWQATATGGALLTTN